MAPAKVSAEDARVQLANWTAWVDRAQRRDAPAELSRKAEWLADLDANRPDLKHLGAHNLVALIERLRTAAKSKGA